MIHEVLLERPQTRLEMDGAETQMVVRRPGPPFLRGTGPPAAAPEAARAPSACRTETEKTFPGLYAPERSFEHAV